MQEIKIRDIKAYITAPGAKNLVVVKITTNEPKIYGLGCATFTQRCKAVAVVVEEYLRPLLIGRRVNDIEDIWQTMMGNSYWRNGPVLNNAISGVDEALWDIKGKMADMPVYELLGGKCRPAVGVYSAAKGKTLKELGDSVEENLKKGVLYNRLGFGYLGDENTKEPMNRPEGVSEFGTYFDPRQKVEEALEMFDYLRKRFGSRAEFMIDVHEKLAPSDAVRFAAELDRFQLFFIEDILPVEQLDWMKRVREVSATPMAIGELFNHPREWQSLIINRQIDYIRCHISQLGGLTPAKKLAVFSEAFGVRTIWHGPGDLTPIGMAAQIHLDLSSPNFALQEFNEYSDAMKEVFPGCPELKNGYVYVHEAPGLGVDFDEEAASKYPLKENIKDMFQFRLPDGTAIRS